jgi:hypothetical protein
MNHLGCAVRIYLENVLHSQLLGWFKESTPACRNCLSQVLIYYCPTGRDL